MDTINKGEKELMDSISDKLKKMNDEQQALWIAVADGMVMAQDIIERRAS